MRGLEQCQIPPHPLPLPIWEREGVRGNFKYFWVGFKYKDFYKKEGGDFMSVETRVKEIIVEQLGVNENEVTPEAKFVDDLGADSLDLVELVMALEEEYNIEISDEDAEKILTVGDAMEYIKSHVAQG